MKRNFAIALLALSTLAAAGKVLAQEPALQATMPFEFTVGGSCSRRAPTLSPRRTVE